MTFLVLVAALQSLCWAKDEDYTFYKKYGHRHKSWDDEVKQGFEAYEYKDCNQALAFLQQALGAQCHDALVYFKLAVCSESLGSSYSALQYYELAARALADLKTPHRYHQEIDENYGRALFKAERYDQALSSLLKASGTGPPHFSVYYLLGLTYAKQQQPQAASEYFEKALAQDLSTIPTEVLTALYAEVAKTYLQKKDAPRALSWLQQALRLNPQDPTALKLQAQANQLRQQQSLLHMLQTLQNPAPQPSPQAVPILKPPPPAAAKLPPLDPSAQEPIPSAKPSVPSTVPSLQPLPPAPPAF